MGLNRTSTTLLYPLSVALAYAVLRTFGSASLPAMVPVCLLWGAAHTSGLVVSQVWLTSAAPREAREFATSIYLSAANVGVILGAWIGGWSISVGGVRGTLWSGWLFTALTLASVVARVWWERRSRAPIARARAAPVRQ